MGRSVLNKAFSGGLVPQNPNDEPADALLERIRAERRTTKQKVEMSREAKNEDELQGRLI